MLKVRYVRLKLKKEINDNLAEIVRKHAYKNLLVSRVDEGGIHLQFTTSREITTIDILGDGTEVKIPVTTMERYQVRIFRGQEYYYMVIYNPSRGSKMQDEILKLISPNSNYFFETLEISEELITKHIESFDSAKLVSVKVRDLKINDNAVGRLEVTSKDGIEPAIAPILQGKFYRTDSKTYDITHKLMKGLVTYISNGTLRVTGSLEDFILPEFEKMLK